MAILFAGVAPMASCSKSLANSTVILISLDGTRPDDVVKERLPSLVSLAERGLQAERLQAEWPTNTFPNHVTLVTGVPPAQHGLVNNAFYDSERGFFNKKNAENWIEAEPLWSILAGYKIPSASYHWVGSEGPWPKTGRGASDWKPFSGRTSEMEKVDQILRWLDREDSASRPRFVTAWFHGADHAGHVAGPDSEAVVRALLAQDQAIHRLIQGLEERNLFETTTLIFVSDHGMASADTRVDLGEKLRESGVEARVIGSGGFASVTSWGSEPLNEEDLDTIVKVASGAGLKAHVRTDFLEGGVFAHPRFGQVIVRAPMGMAIARTELSLKGFHGYAPEEPSMSAILIAFGRGVMANSQVGEVRSIDVAPTVLALLGVKPPSSMLGQPIEAFLTKNQFSGTLIVPSSPLSIVDPD